jgi:hypothetical protein
MAGISPNFFPPPDSSGEMPAEEANLQVRPMKIYIMFLVPPAWDLSAARKFFIIHYF